MNRRRGPDRGAPRSRAPFQPTARWLALQAIQAFHAEGTFVSRTLDDLFVEFPCDPRERRLATELASETIRRKGTLDAILASYVDRPKDRIEPAVWGMLQLGCCQLVCLNHIPAHAAVNETVTLCIAAGQQRAKGFVNGILRSIEREIDVRGEPAPVSLEMNAPADAGRPNPKLADLTPQRLPILKISGRETVLRWVEFARPVFLAPEQDPARALAQTCSLPAWLTTRWLDRLSDADQAFALGLWLTTPGRVALRVNLTQGSRADAVAALQQAGIDAEPGALEESIRVLSAAQLGSLADLREGAFSVQDESAMGAVDLLAPQPGESVIDLCAAPGGKTGHLAERLAGTGRVVACDVDASRLERVRSNVERLGLTNVEMTMVAEDHYDGPAGPFDAALADVPCSNTGVLGKRPEARWRLAESTIERLVPQQQRLLNDACNLVRPGGRVVYSTCSIEKEENEQVVRWLLNGRRDMTLLSERTHRPGAPDDGGYQALLTRVSGEV